MSGTGLLLFHHRIRDFSFSLCLPLVKIRIAFTRHKSNIARAVLELRVIAVER